MKRIYKFQIKNPHRSNFTHFVRKPGAKGEISTHKRALKWALQKLRVVVWRWLKWTGKRYTHYIGWSLQSSFELRKAKVRYFLTKCLKNSIMIRSLRRLRQEKSRMQDNVLQNDTAKEVWKGYKHLGLSWKTEWIRIHRRFYADVYNIYICLTRMLLGPEVNGLYKIS
jgi:hypothetical protein